MGNSASRLIPPPKLHVAILLDGNGRWAQQRHLPRVEGHRAGIESVRDVVETSARLGIKVLTLYAFSVENWKRPASEVSMLMTLLKRYLRLELDAINRNNIRFAVIGRTDELSSDVLTELAAGQEFVVRHSFSTPAAAAPAQRAQRPQPPPEQPSKVRRMWNDFRKQAGF